jgi:hypothetical protein
MKYLLIFFTVTFHGQVLHHQMLSSQGTSKKLSDGIVITQTIGQQSLNGTSNNNYVVMQGFQQSFWGKYIATNIISENAIKTTIYPNPFSTVINIQFSKPITDLINLTIYDIRGVKILEENKKATEAILTVDLSFLPASVYLVRLRSLNLNYYTKIIKK